MQHIYPSFDISVLCALLMTLDLCVVNRQIGNQ